MRSATSSCFFLLLAISFLQGGCSRQPMHFIDGAPALELRAVQDNRVVFSTPVIDKFIAGKDSVAIIQTLPQDIPASENATRDLEAAVAVMVYGARLGTVEVTSGLSDGLLYLPLPNGIDVARALRKRGVVTREVKSGLEIGRRQ